MGIGPNPFRDGGVQDNCLGVVGGGSVVREQRKGNGQKASSDKEECVKATGHGGPLNLQTSIKDFV
jgi:hypothetical protein